MNSTEVRVIIYKFLKEKLKINMTVENHGNYSIVGVELILDDEIISSESVYVEPKDNT